MGCDGRLRLVYSSASGFLAEFCLSCGKMRAATFHPLFEGGLCQTCKVGAPSLPIGHHVDENHT